MLIVHGVYNFKPKVVAYRNDFCLRCGGPRFAQRIRTFDVFHLMFIPLLPLGFWKRWQCAVCRQDPHAKVGTRRAFKWAGIAVLVFLGAIAWTAPNEKEDDRAFMWALRIGGPVGAVLATVHTLKSKPDPQLAELLQQVAPANEEICALCEAPLIRREGWRCSRCGVERTVA